MPEIPAEFMQYRGDNGDGCYPPGQIRALECPRAQLLVGMCYDEHQPCYREDCIHQIWSPAMRQKWICVSLAAIDGTLTPDTALSCFELDNAQLARSFRHELDSRSDLYLIDRAVRTVSIEALRALRGMGRCAR